MIPSKHVNPALIPKQPSVSTRWSNTTKLVGVSLCIALTVMIVVLAYYLFESNSHHHHSSHSDPIPLSSDPIAIPANPNQAELTESVINSQSDPLLSAQTSSYYNQNGEDDLMTSMPLLNQESCEDSPTNCGFNQYSGYLLATDNHEIHYWFVEADTTDDVMDKPLMFWTNGGPGCSGMEGLLVEQGPWRVISTKGELSVEYNPFTWSLEVNMVFLEQPYGVGFSVVDEGDDPVVGDENAAIDMDAVIRNFLVKFPRFQNHPVYTSAESWGGHYVPMTALRILTNNEDGAYPFINYKGFLLGNPYTDYYENFYGFMDSIYGHGLMKSKDYVLYRDYCWNNATAIRYNVICDLVYVGAYYSSYNSDVYAIDWPLCPFEVDWIDNSDYQKSSHIHFKALKSMERILSEPDYESLDTKIPKHKMKALHSKLKGIFGDEANDKNQENDEKSEIEIQGNFDEQKNGMNTASKLKADSTIFSVTKGSDDGYVPCLDRHERLYLRLEEVQKAINVKPYKWGMCALKVWKYWPDSDYYKFMQPYYNKITNSFSEKYNLTLTIYSGDDDSVCGTGGTQFWLNRWDNHVRDPNTDWLPWKSDDLQLGGYHTIYHNVNNLDFNALHLITVRTAGHMVPSTEPGRSLTVLRKFLFELSDYKTAVGEDGW